MNPFTVMVIILFVSASFFEMAHGRIWGGLFYICSALINLAVVMK